MYFPLYVDLTEKNILVIGGGRIATRRVRALMGFAEHITLVSPEATDILHELAGKGKIFLFSRKFKMEDLQNQDIVFAATDDKVLNREIYEACKVRNIPVNVCSDQSLCDFQFPSIVMDQDVVIGINASGQNHHMVKKTRKKIEEVLSVQGENSKYIGEN